MLTVYVSDETEGWVWCIQTGIFLMRLLNLRQSWTNGPLFRPPEPMPVVIRRLGDETEEGDSYRLLLFIKARPPFVEAWD